MTTGNCKKNKNTKANCKCGGVSTFFNLLNGHDSNVTTQHPTGLKMFYANVFNKFEIS